jgi:hypothetical protein
MSITRTALSGFGVFVSLVGLGAQSSETSSSAVPTGCLNVHLYNMVGVPFQTLAHAKQDAERVLATAGVNLVCWRVPADAPEAHIVHLSVTPTWRKNHQADTRRYLVVIIERGFPNSYLPDELGYALPDAQTGVNATVFYDRIERLHKSAEIDLPTLLGHAMAHEIGHVLLGTTEHATAGIMKARWSKADFEVAGLRFMTFTTLQRAEVRRRAKLVRFYGQYGKNKS